LLSPFLPRHCRRWTFRSFQVHIPRASTSSELARRLGRIGFTVCHDFATALRTDPSPPAALHTLLPECSSLRSQAGECSA
jgi:hypothetical protein